MSKVKEQMMKEELEAFEHELGYKEWLRDSYVEPSEYEIAQMEDTFVIKRENIYLYLYSKNNIEYLPSNKGA